MPAETTRNESELLQKLIAGNEEAFRMIYEQYQGRLFLYAYRFVKSKDIADEIVQDVFVTLWEKRTGVQPEKNFTAYLLRIVKNRIIDYLKKAAVDKIMQERLLNQMQAIQNNGHEPQLQQELIRLHNQAVELLSPQRKVIYLLSREEELTYAQIAEKLNISRHTVRNQMTDAISSIREYISSHPDLTMLAIAASGNIFLK